MSEKAEKYQPSPEEILKAEQSMDDEQRRMSRSIELQGDVEKLEQTMDEIEKFRSQAFDFIKSKLETLIALEDKENALMIVRRPEIIGPYLDLAQYAKELGGGGGDAWKELRIKAATQAYKWLSYDIVDNRRVISNLSQVLSKEELLELLKADVANPNPNKSEETYIEKQRQIDELSRE